MTEVEFDPEDVAPDDDELMSISALAEQQLTLETEVDQIEDVLKVKKAELRRIQENVLPDAMMAANVRDFTLGNGAKITIKEDISISVPKKRMDEITGWLRDEGHEAMIKNEILVAFPPGTDNMVGEVRGKAEELGLTTLAITTVHSATLKAMIKRAREDGKLNKELEFFGAYAWRKTILTQ